MGAGTPWTRRIAVVIALSLVAAACGSSGDSSSQPKRPKGPEYVDGDPCTILSADKVAKVFSEPITVDPTNNMSPLTTDCAFVVGDPLAPTGRLVVNIVFPAIGAGEGADALSVVEGDRAIAQLAGPGVFDLELGTPGFLESSRSVAEFFVTPELALSLQWYPTGGAPEGSPVTEDVEAQLKSLATDITARLGRAL